MASSALCLNQFQHMCACGAGLNRFHSSLGRVCLPPSHRPVSKPLLSPALTHSPPPPSLHTDSPVAAVRRRDAVVRNPARDGLRRPGQVRAPLLDPRPPQARPRPHHGCSPLPPPFDHRNGGGPSRRRRRALTLRPLTGPRIVLKGRSSPRRVDSSAGSGERWGEGPPFHGLLDKWALPVSAYGSIPPPPPPQPQPQHTQPHPTPHPPTRARARAHTHTMRY